MRARRLQKWWRDVPVTILGEGASREPGSNTISDVPVDADLVWDPGCRLDDVGAAMRAVLRRRGPDVYTLETSGSRGDIADPKTIVHFQRRADAMAEIAVKLGSRLIHVDPARLSAPLLEKFRETGIQVVGPEEGNAVAGAE